MNSIISKMAIAFGASCKKSAPVHSTSIQSELFNYLKPEQKEILKTILRLIKHRYQTVLCIALLDYLEGFGYQSTGNPMLDSLQHSIIELCKLHPLRAPMNN